MESTVYTPDENTTGSGIVLPAENATGSTIYGFNS